MNRADLAKFGTPDFPLRASSLPKLLACPWRAVLLFSHEFEDRVGPSAHTGTAVHKAVEIYHTARKSFDDCLAESLGNAEAGGYPLADADETRLHFRGYYDDPRNQGAVVSALEKEFQLTLEEEETRVTFKGTFDQIRFDNGLSILYDIKTGRSLDAYNMLMEHTLQLACYWLGSRELGFDVQGVGIIYTYGYRRRGYDGSGVFLRHPLRFDDCHRLMKGVFRVVKDIRAGRIDVRPGAHCSICPALSIATCLPIASEFGI